jgi:fructose-bisphosphate aldolase, class II
MTWADPRELLRRAQEGGYAVGAFNMHSDETAQALVRAAEEASSPVFLQVGRAIVPHMGVAAATALTRRAAEGTTAPVVLHLDHGPWDEVFESIKLGFGSVMYDGAHLPFEENIATTKRIVEVAHDFGLPVEAELGKIPDADEKVDWSAYYTDVKEAERFVAETGVDWLAVSVGIMHGVPMDTPEPLDIQRIRDIKEATGGIPLVLHGASGVPDDEIRAATEAGIVKFNADTDLRHAFRAGIEETWAKGDRQFEEAVALGRQKMIAATVEKFTLFGCAGKA